MPWPRLHCIGVGVVMFSLYFIEGDVSHTQICSRETLSGAYFLLIDTNRNKTSEMSGGLGSALWFCLSLLTNNQNQIINKTLTMDGFD